MHDANEPASQGSELRTFQAEVDAGAEALGQTRGPSRPQRPENQPRAASGWKQQERPTGLPCGALWGVAGSLAFIQDTAGSRSKM